MKNRKHITNIFSIIPPQALSAIARVKVIIPYYHMVSDNEVIHTKHLYPHKPVRQFVDDLDYLLKYFRPVFLTDLLFSIKSDTTLPPKALHLTFDDGFREIHDVIASILLQKGIAATFFVNSGFTDNHSLCYQHKASLIAERLLHNNISKAGQKRIEDLLPQNVNQDTAIASRILAIKYGQKYLIDQIAEILEMDFSDYLQKYQPYLTTQQVQKLMSDGFTIGAHSIDHPLYAELDLKEQLRQTMESVRFVRNAFDLNYGAFAFPHSDNGVSRQYFTQVEKSGLVDISFGTSGIIKDCVPNHFQRFSLERPLIPAQNIIAYQYARAFWHTMNRNNVIRRKEN